MAKGRNSMYECVKGIDVGFQWVQFMPYILIKRERDKEWKCEWAHTHTQPIDTCIKYIHHSVIALNPLRYHSLWQLPKHLFRCLSYIMYLVRRWNRLLRECEKANTIYTKRESEKDSKRERHRECDIDNKSVTERRMLNLVKLMLLKPAEVKN